MERMLKAVSKKALFLRKAFLTDFIKVHYAQFGEDIILKELIEKDKKEGFFVDVGCYHPRKFNNTYALYKRGWRGINIDMEEDKIALFELARPGDVNIVCAVSDKRERLTRYRDGRFSLGSTISDNHARRTGADYETRTVETKTLTEIIDGTRYQERQIDLLTIDAEGMDYAALKSLDMKRYRPKIIIVEDHHRDIDAVVETDIYRLLRDHSYYLRSWAFYSLIFLLPDADIVREREQMDQ